MKSKQEAWEYEQLVDELKPSWLLLV